MKTDTLFKRAFNEALDLISELADGTPLPSENALSARLGVSRTTLRKVPVDAGGARGRDRKRASTPRPLAPHSDATLPEAERSTLGQDPAPTKVRRRQTKAAA